MARLHPDPCTCGHELQAHRRGRHHPRNRYVCDCGCVIEFHDEPTTDTPADPPEPAD